MKSIRKQWLISFLIAVGLLSLNLILFFTETGLERAVAGGTFIGSMIWAFTTYHCAYKNNGTKWLTWVLIATPYQMFKEICITVKSNEYIPGTEEFFWYYFLVYLVAANGVWFWINCWKLRNENKILKTPSSQPEDQGDRTIAEILPL